MNALIITMTQPTPIKQTVKMPIKSMKQPIHYPRPPPQGVCLLQVVVHDTDNAIFGPHVASGYGISQIVNVCLIGFFTDVTLTKIEFPI